MPQKVLKFAGINRAVNEFQGAGACEELINLRPMAGGGHRVIKNKNVVEQDVNYDKFFEHTWGEHYNQIVIEDGVVKWWNSPDEPKTITNEFERKEVSLSFAGNVLVIYCAEDQKQLVFKFDEGEYVRYDVSIKPITDIRVAYDYLSTFPASYSVSVDANNETGYEEALAKAASGFYTAHPHGLCGAAIVGCEYELVDGNKLWSTAFTVANVTEHEEYKAPTLDVDNKRVLVNGVKDVRLHLTFGNVESGDIRRINVYATRPVFPYDVVRDGDGLNAKYQVKKVSLDDVNLAGQIMYYQGSVSPNNTSADLLLSFGKEQAGAAIMDVNAGCIERLGENVSFNNRFHFFKSHINHLVQLPTVSKVLDARTQAEPWIAYVKLKDKWILIDRYYKISDSTPNDFIYPMLGVKELRFVKCNLEGQPLYEDVFSVKLEDSSAYNFSYAFGVTPDIKLNADSWFDLLLDNGQLLHQVRENGYTKKVFWENETNEINVSAPYNPFVFPVNYSYGLGGEIIDICTSYLPVSAVQYGQYPITVFTTNGIYALEQGNGATLYGNIVPLQPYVLDGPALSTPVGTFFISSNNLYLLSGRDSLCLSIIMNGDIDRDLRKLSAYNALCFDLQPMISNENFEEYLTSANLVYDTFQNELWICSSKPDVKYSYVFNIATKMFHKAHKKISSEQISSRYAIEHDYIYNNISLIDTYDESTSYQQHILLQSRPMPLDVLFSHIQRLILYTDTKLEGDQKLCLSVFASDDLYDWKCIISSQKKDTVLRHIRTNRAAKSYRDYVFIISGTVFTDTDISDLIADYTTVSRRLG